MAGRGAPCSSARDVVGSTVVNSSLVKSGRTLASAIAKASAVQYSGHKHGGVCWSFIAVVAVLLHAHGQFWGAADSSPTSIYPIHWTAPPLNSRSFNFGSLLMPERDCMLV